MKKRIHRTGNKVVDAANGQQLQLALHRIIELGGHTEANLARFINLVGMNHKIVRKDMAGRFRWFWDKLAAFVPAAA